MTSLQEEKSVVSSLSLFFLSIRAATLRFLVTYDDNDNPLKMSGATTVIHFLAYKLFINTDK